MNINDKIRILILFFVFFLNIALAFEEGDEEIINLEIEEPGFQKVIYEPEIEEFKPYSKEALRAIITKDYDIKSPEGMLKEQLKLRSEFGLIKEAGVQGSFISRLGDDFNKDDSTFKFNQQLINLGIKGKFKSEKEGFNFLFDLTPHHDNFFHKFVLDAWVETKRIPHHTLMFGTSRPNVGLEGGQSPYTLPFFSRSQTARTFGNIRKTGVRLKGDFKYIDYDIGGYSSDTWYSEFMPGVETDIWADVKPLEKHKEKLGSLRLGGGLQAGSRNSSDFFVTSTALSYDYKNFWLRAEYQHANGYNGGGGLSSKSAQGYNVTLAYRLTKKLEFLLRYDDFDPNKAIANNNKKEYSAGINYYILGQCARLILNYVFCDNGVAKNSNKIMFGAQVLL